MPSPSAPARLGRGLSLKQLTATPIINLRTDVVLSEAAPVKLDQIQPSPHNARGAIERDKAFAELKASIRTYGLVQPLVVRKVGVCRILIAGHRRHAALRELAAEEPGDARWQSVLVIERDVDEQTAEALGLIENLQRTDLEPLDEAQAFVRLRDVYGLSLGRIAEQVNKSKMYVSNRVRLASDPVLSDAVATQALPVSTAEVLLRAPKAERSRLVGRAKAERWTTERARTVVLDRGQALGPVSAPVPVTPSRRFGVLIHQLEADLPILEQVADTLDPAERVHLHSLVMRAAALTANEA